MITPLFVDKDEADPVILACAEAHRTRRDLVKLLEEEARDIEQQVDDYNLSRRPELPTDGQRLGLLEALRRIRLSEEPKSHHGDPCCSGDGPDVPYAVKVDGARGWISVGHLAPYSKRRGGSKLWGFDDLEVEVIKSIIRLDGYEIVDEWLHDSGVSLIVRSLR